MPPAEQSASVPICSSARDPSAKPPSPTRTRSGPDCRPCTSRWGTRLPETAVNEVGVVPVPESETA